MEARRTELRGKMDEGHFSVPKANYLALLALPEPPLRDCCPAMNVFRQQQDWPALATALEAAGATLRRVMAAPPEEFVKATDDPPEIREGEALKPSAGPYVYVQADLNGVWRHRNGAVGDYLPAIIEKQKSLRPECANVHLELARLCRDRLQKPKESLRAFEIAVQQQPFCTEPLETLVPKVWPTPKTKTDVLWASTVAWDTRAALRELADIREQMGDLPGALDARIRGVLAARLSDGRWGGEENVWSLVLRLPPGSPMPSIPWINVLTPSRPGIRFDLPATSARPEETAPPALAVVAGPGHRFASIDIIADMESQGQYGEFECRALIHGAFAQLGRVQWHLAAKSGREEGIASFPVPADAQVLHFGVVGHVKMHSAVVKATFAAPAAQPATQRGDLRKP